MPRTRETHISKTPEERRLYWQTVIRAAGPTLEDTTPIIDTTDRSATIEEKRIGSVTTQKTQSAFVRFLKERTTEIAITVAIALFAWVLLQLYGLNREVGELKTTRMHIESQINKVETGLSEKIGVLSSDLRRLEQRIDGLLDRFLGNRTKSNAKSQK
ncbi:MAG: hypothetical protein ABSB32_18790 [Thermodesulfobacteriota bacterium]|jgi:hypothetical protein